MSVYYSDDSVTLYLGDCRDDHELWTSPADLLITDPPYGIAWRRSANSARGSKAHAGIANDGDTSCRNDAIFLWGSQRPGAYFGALTVPPVHGVKQVLIWHKPPDSGVVGSTTGFRRDIEGIYLIGGWPNVKVRRSSVLRSVAASIGNPSSAAGRTGHPHAKPVDLIGQLLEMAPAGCVADPFAGSGSILVAAKLAGRKAVGVEIDERYCEIAAKRLAQDVLDFGASA